MMRNLLVEEGGLVQVDNVSLPIATFAKFQPQSVDFLDITNPKAVYPFAKFIIFVELSTKYLFLSSSNSLCHLFI